MDEKIKILLFEDNPGDANLIEEMLEESADFPYELTNVETLKEGLKFLKELQFNVILSDLRLPDSDGIDTFLDIHAANSRIPIIILTGIHDEKTGIVSVKKGAQDYLVKGQVDGRLLNRSIRYSIERKRAEEELQKSEERYRIVTEQTGQLIYDYNIKENEISWAGAVEEITGYPAEEFKSIHGMPSLENAYPDLKPLLEGINEYQKRRGKFKRNFRFRRRDGKYIHIEESCICLVDENGDPYRALGTVTDITEKKEAEETLAKIEEVRKKEIHHRIKNNLQIVSSLLDLQAEKFAEDNICDTLKVLKAFKDSQNRVISMALIHEELYESKDMSTLNFAAYLKKLTKELFRCYNVDSSGTFLDLEIEEKVFLEMDTVVPLGILVNELISNSLKHAFPSVNEGKIQVKLYREMDGERNTEAESKNRDISGTHFTLIVSDNGVGVPEDLDLENPETLGMQLITALVDQLDGELEVNRDCGTEFCIKFAIEESN
ncbi:histidine kinase dimerization/phosphoacceptor domain -containing protein [Methanosarcina hadiensis]|uniref:sensor histidine kinase n=1 Tax=Methanosarcina hadiensis TaxID=3078083 RepID=UPI003977CA1D